MLAASKEKDWEVDERDKELCLLVLQFNPNLVLAREEVVQEVAVWPTYGKFIYSSNQESVQLWILIINGQWLKVFYMHIYISLWYIFCSD